MARQVALSVISGLAWISAIAASTPGTSGKYLGERSEIGGANCTSPTNISLTCWYQLDIPAYLMQWDETHPTCNATANEADCCISGESWSMCFMRLAYAFDSSLYAAYGLTCNKFGSCREPPLAPSLPSDITIQEFYVLNTIYAINALFSELNDCKLSTTDPREETLIDAFRASISSGCRKFCTRVGTNSARRNTERKQAFHSLLRRAPLSSSNYPAPPPLFLPPHL